MKLLIFKRGLKAAFVGLVAVVVTACGGNEGNDPLAVANGFWASMISQNPSNAIMYMSEKERLRPVFNGFKEGDTFKFTKAHKEQMSEGILGLDTQLILQRDGGVKVVPIKTILVNKNGVWLVDYYSTKVSLYDAVLEKIMYDVNDMLITGVETLESEMPEFEGKEDDKLKQQIDTFMKPFGEELYHTINGARLTANKVHMERGEGSVQQRMKLLEESNKAAQ